MPSVPEQREAPRELFQNYMRQVPTTYARQLVDEDGKQPVFTDGSLCMWAIPARVLQTLFTINICIDPQGATMSVANKHRVHLDLVLEHEMKGMITIGATRH